MNYSYLGALLEQGAGVNGYAEFWSGILEQPHMGLNRAVELTEKRASLIRVGVQAFKEFYLKRWATYFQALQKAPLNTISKVNELKLGPCLVWIFKILYFVITSIACI